MAGLNAEAERFVAPEQYRVVHCRKTPNSLRQEFALLQVKGKVFGFHFTASAIKISNQVFRSMTNRSFVNV